ncbi:hypothetical protein COP2_024634 [Malus domestica]
MNQKNKNGCFPKYITNWAKFELVLCDCSLTRAGLGVPWASLGGLNGGAAVVAGRGGGKDGGLEVGLGGGGLRIDVGGGGLRIDVGGVGGGGVEIDVGGDEVKSRFACIAYFRNGA